MTVYAGARVVTPGGVIERGWVSVEDGRIVAVGDGARPADACDLGGGWLLPGFIDVHVHGGGGFDVTKSPDDMRAAVEFHRRHGTTRTLVSLMAAPVDALCEQLGWVRGLVDDELVIGAHLEGPFLSAARCGAQNHAHLLEPDALVLAKLLDAAQGSLRQMTVAAELPGALDLVRELVAAGVVAAIGHTDATYEQASAAFAAGARLATHLFNAMGPVSHRAPGAAVAALDGEAILELINDGVHVHDALVRVVAGAAPDRVVLITDAVSAAGAGDGCYTLGDRDVVVQDGEARLSGSTSLAGSTLTMDDAVRRFVRDVGLPIEAAASAAATTPARLLGIDDECGSIATGLAADMVHLDDEFALHAVMCRGSWL